MNRKQLFLTASFWLFTALILRGQSERIFTIQIVPTYQNTPFKLGETLNVDSLQITAFRFYLSDFQLFKNKNKVWSETNSYHLIDAAKPASLRLALHVPKDLEADSLRFSLGIDSLTNAEGAKSGDLDPSNGMYWAWQSGYINFKLEGASRLCPARKHRFEFHLGGFIGADYALQKLTFPLKKAHFTEGGILTFDVADFLSKIDLKTTHHIMSPSSKAVNLAKEAQSIFKFK